MEGRRDGARSDPPSPPTPAPPLHDQARLFGAIVMGARDGVVVTALDGTIAWANHAAAALFDLPLEELPGRRLTELVPDEARAQVRDLHQRVVAGREADPIQTSGWRRDAAVVELSATPDVRDEGQGHPRGVAVVLRDITEEQRLQRELTRAGARSRARFDQSPQPQALLDGEGRIVEVNDAACELLGYARPELVGRRLWALFDSDLPDAAGRLLDRLGEGSTRSVTFETTGLCKDATRIPLLVDLTAVRDAEGTAFEFAALVRDLRESRDAEHRLASQQAFFRALHREASDVTLVTDAKGALRYTTPSVTQVLGYEPEQLQEILASSLARADDVAGQGQRRRQVLEMPGARARDTVRIQDAQGRWRWFDTTATNCVDDPDIGGIVINLREVTPEIEAQQALRDSEARYRAIAETAQAGILAVSPEGDTLFANERLAEILGISMEQVYALGGSRIFPPADVGRAARRMGGRRPQAEPERSDVLYQHPDGTERVLLVSASPLAAADGTVLGSLAMVSDVTEQRSAEETLRRQALHDALTGLPNRLLFVERLTLAAAHQKRTEHGPVAVLFLDLDHFKLVNDSHGHQTGDRVLVEVASRLEQAVRTTDTVARLGGDEFAVICEGADSATADRVASRIQHAFTEPIHVDGEGLEVSMSIGVALSPPHQAEDLPRLADMAMYQAKATARGRVVRYDEGLPDDTTRRLGVVRAVREALDDDAVPLRYEPVVDLRTGVTTGLRADLHWEHPTLGRLSRGEVLRAAESSGLASALQASVTRTALRRLADRETRAVITPDVFVAVQITPGPPDDPQSVSWVEEALGATDVPPNRLVLEVDESAVRDERDRVHRLSRRLQDLGVGLGVSGVGRQTAAAPPETELWLEHLRDLPLARLELDRGLVERLAAGSDALALARAVVSVAAASHATAAGAGLASVEQAALLADVGCAQGRGPIFGRPVPGDSLAEQFGDLSRSAGHTTSKSPAEATTATKPVTPPTTTADSIGERDG